LVVMPVRTGGPTAKWQPDGQSEGTESSYAQRRFLVEQLTAHTDVSNSLLEDSAFDLEAELRRDFAEEFGRAEGLAFVHGDGTGQPQGLLHAGVEPAIETVANGGTSNLTAEGIIKLYHALPQFYAANAVWMMNRSTMGAMRALSFPGGTAFVWTENLALGNPPTLLGRPVVEVPDMPDMASGSTPIAFGDLSQAYRIFDRVSLSVLRDPYSVQTQGLVRFHARRRVGGGVVKSEAVKLLKMVAS
jgi:HK97 family phage major capsid protein